MSPPHQRLQSRAERAMEAFRGRLAHAEALPQLAFVGLLSGAVTSAIAIAFRLAIEIPLAASLPDGNSEGFEALPLLTRLVLPIAGAIVVALLYTLIRDGGHRLGVSHAIERYQLHQGQFSLRTMVLQFIAGAAALISGHSGGREGPAVHLGAAGSSLLGQWLRLPNNTLRVMSGCGIAAAIAASFNTPLAGVIFAMEVVMMEYTVAGFLPIILAAVVGAIACRLVFGHEPAFALPPIQTLDLQELPWLIVSGVAIGLAGGALLVVHKKLLRFRNRSHWGRFLLVGLITGTAGVFVPEILGLGYDTVQQTLLGEIPLAWLSVIVVTKFIVFTTTYALGSPVGGIGPMFFLGATLGSATGILAHQLSPELGSGTALYAILGMGGMMAAALNAPLAALVAILELTNNPVIIMPSLLVVVTATITARMTSRLPGLFLIGYDPQRFTSPVMQMLNRHGVTRAMTTRLFYHSRYLPWSKTRSLFEAQPVWIVIADPGAPHYLLRPADLARYLEEQDTALWAEDQTIDLLEIPASREQLIPIHPGATLQEAWVLLRDENARALYVRRQAPPLMSDIAGIVTRDDIEAFYNV